MSPHALTANKVVMAGLDPATQGHTLMACPWVAGSRAGYDEDWLGRSQ